MLLDPIIFPSDPEVRARISRGNVLAEGARRRRDAARAEREQQRKRRSSSPLELDPNQDVNVDQLIEQASDRIDELLEAPTPRANAKSLDLDESNGAALPKAEAPEPEVAAATATFGKPKSRRPGPKRERPKPAINTSRKPAPPIAARAKGPGDARMRQIYESYVDAKRKNNERTDKIDYETVAKSLKKMVPKLDRKHKGKRIDFKVIVKDGKVGIKPVVKK